jgi:hypothetical protein
MITLDRSSLTLGSTTPNPITSPTQSSSNKAILQLQFTKLVIWHAYNVYRVEVLIQAMARLYPDWDRTRVISRLYQDTKANRF